jgi:hypothetical protein
MAGTFAGKNQDVVICLVCRGGALRRGGGARKLFETGEILWLIRLNRERLRR